MSLERASGVILRTRLLTDTSLIVHWLTPTLGRLATVAKGARRPKSPLRGKLDLFYEADFSFQRSRRSDLHTLREVVLTATHPALRTNLAQLRQAAYAALLIELATEPEAPLGAAPALFRELLASLGGGPAPHRLLAFELKLLADLGFQPDLAGSRLSPGTQKIGQALTDLPFTELGRIHLTPAQLAELARFLGGFITYHLGRVPTGRTEALGWCADAGPTRRAGTVGNQSNCEVGDGCGLNNAAETR